MKEVLAHCSTGSALETLIRISVSFTEFIPAPVPLGEKSPKNLNCLLFFCLLGRIMAEIPKAIKIVCYWM